MERPSGEVNAWHSEQVTYHDALYDLTLTLTLALTLTLILILNVPSK